MKKRTFLMIISILSLVSISHAQVPTNEIRIDSVKFSEQVTFELDVHYGDSLTFNFYKLNGHLLSQLPKQAFYKSENFNWKLNPLNNGFYLALTILNSEQIASGLIHDGITNKATINLNVNVVGLDNDHLLIYPNPTTSSYLNVEIRSFKETIKLKMYNLEGKEIFSNKLSNSIGLLTEKIDISTLREGQYIIAIISKNGITTEKFIKNR